MSSPAKIHVFPFVARQLSFRSSTNALAKIREQVRKLLQFPPTPPAPVAANVGGGNTNRVVASSACREVEAALSNYMRRAADSFDLTKTEEVRKGEMAS